MDLRILLQPGQISSRLRISGSCENRLLTDDTSRMPFTDNLATSLLLRYRSNILNSRIVRAPEAVCKIGHCFCIKLALPLSHPFKVI